MTPVGRALVVGTLFLAEYMLVSFLFEVQSLRGGAGLGALFGYIDLLVPLILSSATVLVLVAGVDLRHELQRLASEQSSPRRMTVSLVLQVLTFSCFLLLTRTMVTDASGTAGLPVLTMIAWLLSGGLAGLLLVNSLTPLERLPPLFRQLAALLSTAAVIGVMATLVGESLRELLWTYLSTATLANVSWLLKQASPDSFVEAAPPTVGAGDFAVIVDSSCSGYEGIGLMLVFFSVYLWTQRRSLRYPRVLVLLPLAVSAVWIANSLRIAALVLIGAYWSPDVALGGFHSKAGWVLFCAVALTFAYATQRSAYFSREVTATVDNWNPTAAHLVPMLVLAATTMFMSLFTSRFYYFYPVSMIATMLALYAYRGYFRARWTPHWAPVLIGLLVFIIWLVMEPEPDAQHVADWLQALLEMPPLVAGGWVACRLLGSTLVVPAAEELAFRGFLLRRLVSPDFTRVARTEMTLLPILASSLIFAAFHQRFWAAAIAGVGYGVALRFRGRLSDAIVAHAVTNALLGVLALLTGRWSLWL